MAGFFMRQGMPFLARIFTSQQGDYWPRVMKWMLVFLIPHKSQFLVDTIQ